MAEPRVVDTVTFRNFGAVGRLEILRARLRGYDNPRCVEAVWYELMEAADEPECQRVLETDILGPIYEVAMEDFAEVFRIRRALGVDEQDSKQHLGEAESILVADRLNGTFVTDDSGAFAFAMKNLGDNRVLDTVDLLRESVAAGELTTHEAKLVADGIRNSGRHLRAGHPPTLMAEYFRF